MFYHLSTKGPERFLRVFGTEEQIINFWKGQDLAAPYMVDHPATKIENFQQRCIVGKLHSDGVVMTKHDSLHVISMLSMHADGDLLDIVLYFGSVVKRCIATQAVHGSDTMAVLYRQLAWSLSACLYNRHPALDWNNNPWPADHPRAVLANTKLNENDFSLELLGCVPIWKNCATITSLHTSALYPHVFYVQRIVAQCHGLILAPTAYVFPIRILLLHRDPMHILFGIFLAWVFIQFSGILCMVWIWGQHNM